MPCPHRVSRQPPPGRRRTRPRGSCAGSSPRFSAFPRQASEGTTGSSTSVDIRSSRCAWHRECVPPSVWMSLSRRFSRVRPLPVWLWRYAEAGRPAPRWPCGRGLSGCRCPSASHGCGSPTEWQGRQRRTTFRWWCVCVGCWTWRRCGEPSEMWWTGTGVAHCVSACGRGAVSTGARGGGGVPRGAYAIGRRSRQGRGSGAGGAV